MGKKKATAKKPKKNPLELLQKAIDNGQKTFSFGGKTFNILSKKGLMLDGKFYRPIDTSKKTTWKILDEGTKAFREFRAKMMIASDKDKAYRAYLKNAFKKSKGKNQKFPTDDEKIEQAIEAVIISNGRTGQLKKGVSDHIMKKGKKQKVKDDFELDVIQNVKHKTKRESEYAHDEKGDRIPIGENTDGSIKYQQAGSYEDRKKNDKPNVEKYTDYMGGKQSVHDGIEIIEDQAMRKKLLQRGRFGYALKGLLFPMWKDADYLKDKKSSWGLVNNEMTDEEIDLFKKMSKMNDHDAVATYYKYYKDVKKIPKKVIVKGLDYANNEYTQIKMKEIQRELGTNPSEGFNINFKVKDGNWVFGRLRGTQKVLPMESLNKIPEELQEHRVDWKIEKAENTATNTDGKITKDEAKQALQQMIISENNSKRDERQRRRAKAKEAKEDGEAKEEEAKEEQEAKEEIEEVEANVRFSISERRPDLEKKRQEQQQQDEGMTNQDSYKKDDIPDVSKFGHQLAVQNVFTSKGKDFSYLKSVFAQNPSMRPSNDFNKRKQQVDLCLLLYGNLLPIEKIQTNYSMEESLEILVLKHGYIENVEFERNWKMALLNLGKVTQQQQQIQPSFENQGFIINTEDLGMKATDLFKQKQTNTAEPNISPQKDNTAEPMRTPPRMQQDNNNKRRLVEQNEIQKINNLQKHTKNYSQDVHEPFVKQPDRIKPKSTKKQKNQRLFKNPITLKVRNRKINPNRLYTNMRSQNPEPVNDGILPALTFRKSNKKNKRVKLNF